MAIAFFCTKCGNSLSALYAGEEVTCPHCGEVNAAPLPPAEAAAPVAPTPVAPATDGPTLVMPPPPPATPVAATPPPAAYSTPPAYGAAPPPRRRGLGWACCCGCGALAALLGLLVVILALVAAPKIKGQAYLGKAIEAEQPVITALTAYTSNPAWKTVKTHEFSMDNMGEARDALESLAKSSADARHAVDAAEKALAGTKPPADLAELGRQMSDLNGLLSDGLNDMEPQVDYLAFIVKSLGTAAKSFRELEGSSVGGLDSAADLLGKCRTAVKAIHDEIMVKSAPPGCEKLHTDTIKSLEAMSSACSEMSAAIRARDYGRMLSLAKSFESSMTSAAKRFESAYDSWGTKSDQRATEFGKQVQDKLNALVKQIEAAQAKYGLPTTVAPPAANDDKAKR
ncbi:MAG: hypothetical protein HZB16_05705 [Armatimonadetes bacterium]|nr:hypothetical protein [Armatimonadota bacterium]